ncbi:hypothetical protein A9Q98_08450 [Thalassotalea sp. 42_200_T64]|nr:hypothetical protein A9Q98_08450 [Thalassotalea sp. 42_200_T64]
MTNNQQPQHLIYPHTIRGKVLLFIAVLSVYVSSLFYYSFEQKNQLAETLHGIESLQYAENILLEADLAVFDAITQLIVLFEPAARQQVLEDVHQQFKGLTRHYDNISKLYPERAPSFYALLGSLAKVIMSPSPEDLKEVRVNLEVHKSQLNSLIKENQIERQQLIKNYDNISNAAAQNLVIFALSGLVVLLIISSIFFAKMGHDINRVLSQIKLIIARKTTEPLENRRSDEIGVLIAGVNHMSQALDYRDQQLHIERLHKSYLDSIGAIEHLTAGLVHEIGNPVAAISGMISEIEYQQEALPETVKTYIASIKDYNNKLQLINKDLANLAAPTSSEYQLLDLNELISQSQNLLHYDERWYGVKINFVQAPLLPALYGNSGQIKQLLNNLLNNCLEAKVNAEHEINIETEFHHDEIVLTIKDNGSGMDNATLAQIFNAFFTTKDPLLHSGMGLFSCLNIVESHGSRINICSQPKQGTEVKVYFSQQQNSSKTGGITNED